MSHAISIGCQRPYVIHLQADFSIPYATTPKVLISDRHVGPLYKEQVLSVLDDCYYIEIPAGESFKTREMKQKIEDELLLNHFGRDVHIYALGGGVILDLVGFLASTYCRGVKLTYLPTTLLAMVDVIVGGKTGVNTPQGKNMIGSFYTPSAVYANLNTLQSLSMKEYTAGIQEMIKHALLFDDSLLCYLNKHTKELLAKDISFLEHVIQKSILMKARVIEDDEFESGKRALLNFGHTVGHAIEKVSFYQVLHGHAIGIGMLIEAYMASGESALTKTILDFLKAYECPIDFALFNRTDDILDAMHWDKKNCDNSIQMVYLKNINAYQCHENQYTFPITKEQVLHAFTWVKDYLQC